MRTIKKIITDVSSRYGAPMGRPNIGTRPKDKRIFDCFVPMSGYGEYDAGGAYWGAPDPIYNVRPLRVAYTKDLTYIRFYRSYKREDNPDNN